MSAEVLGSLDDGPRETEPVGGGLELDGLDADHEGHADLLAALGADLVRLHLFAAVRRGAHEISREDQVVEMPQIVRVLHAELDLARLRITVEHAHATEAMESDLISAYCDSKLRKHVYGRSEERRVGKDERCEM